MGRYHKNSFVPLKEQMRRIYESYDKKRMEEEQRVNNQEERINQEAIDNDYGPFYMLMLGVFISTSSYVLYKIWAQ